MEWVEYRSVLKLSHHQIHCHTPETPLPPSVAVEYSKRHPFLIILVTFWDGYIIIRIGLYLPARLVLHILYCMQWHPFSNTLTLNRRTEGSYDTIYLRKILFGNRGGGGGVQRFLITCTLWCGPESSEWFIEGARLSRRRIIWLLPYPLSPSCL